jgi:hypothetical protein
MLGCALLDRIAAMRCLLVEIASSRRTAIDQGKPLML